MVDAALPRVARPTLRRGWVLHFLLDTAANSATLSVMPHRQRISPDLRGSGFYTPDTEFHEERHGWGKVSKTGKTILWEDYKPLTKRQREAENRRRQKRNEWFKTPEGQAYIRRTDQFIDDMFARRGTTREAAFKTICDVIEKAPPISTLFPASDPADAIRTAALEGERSQQDA